MTFNLEESALVAAPVNSHLVGGAHFVDVDDSSASRNLFVLF